jgi:RNA polymerase sigma factor (TIGR02999 family)
MAEDRQITLLLHDFADGKKEALDGLIPLVYAELRKTANGYLRQERSGHTLQPTALVHELYARLLGQEHPDCRSRAHFLGVAAQLMRQILIDHARTKHARKRGGGCPKLSLDEAYDTAMERPSVMIRIDDALQDLERQDPRKARLIEMRFFGGLTADESAEVLQLPVNTIRRELRVAQAWLHRELDRNPASD